MYHCRFCMAIFADQQLFNAHEERHRRLYPCRVCHQHYPTRYALFRHAKRLGHYLNKEQTGALPLAHHIAFKGQADLTRGPRQFGSSRHPLAPPSKHRELTKRQIIDIYRPRENPPRVVDCRRPTLRTVIPPRRTATPPVEPQPSTSGLTSRRAPPSSVSYSTITVQKKIPQKRPANKQNGNPKKRPAYSQKGNQKRPTHSIKGKQPQEKTSNTVARKETKPEVLSLTDSEEDSPSRRHTTKFDILDSSDSEDNN